MSVETELAEPIAGAGSTRALGEGVDAAATRSVGANSDTGRIAHFLYISVNVGSRAGMFLLMIVLTRHLSVMEYGLLTLAVTMGEILDVTLTDWVRIHLLRSGASKIVLGADALGRSLLLAGMMGLLGLAIATLVMPMVDRAHATQLIIATTSYIVAFGLLRLALILAQSRQHHSLYVSVEGTRAVGIFVVSGVVIAGHLTNFVSVCLLLTGLTGTVGLIGLLVNLARLPRPRIPSIGYLPAIQFGFPLALSAILGYSLGWIDRLIINYFTGPAQVALYAAAYAVARQPVELIITSLNNFIFPMLVRANASEDPLELARLQGGLVTTYSIVGLGIMAVLSLLAKPLATLLFPPEYRESVATLMPLISFGAYCLALHNFVFASSMIVTGRTWLNLASAAPPAISTMIFGVVLIRYYGAHGAAIAFALGATVAAVTGATLSLRVLKFGLPWLRLAATVAAIVTAATSTWLVLAALHNPIPIVALAIGTITFGLVYALCLTLVGLSAHRLITTPWAPFDDDSGRAGNSDSAPLSARGPTL